MDGQTDGIGVAYTRYSIYAVVCKNIWRQTTYRWVAAKASGLQNVLLQHFPEDQFQWTGTNFELLQNNTTVKQKKNNISSQY